MTYKGHVENGMVVLDDPVELPEGAAVSVAVLDFFDEHSPADDVGPTLYDRLEPVVGKAKGLPPDAAANVHHYLYGTPKR
jgi:hypothetical protein